MFDSLHPDISLSPVMLPIQLATTCNAVWDSAKLRIRPESFVCRTPDSTARRSPSHQRFADQSSLPKVKRTLRNNASTYNFMVETRGIVGVEVHRACIVDGQQCRHASLADNWKMPRLRYEPLQSSLLRYILQPRFHGRALVHLS
jgi:hypothetical protein